MPREAVRDAVTVQSHFSVRDKPHWDCETRKLFWRGRVLKHFRQPAQWQVLTLAAFEELGWPECIDDPLPGAPGCDAKIRLHDAIRGLNRGHRFRAINFHGRGDGQGICWSRVAKMRNIG